MMITCPGCQASYNVPDSALPAGVSQRFQCPRCQQSFEVHGPAAPAADSPVFRGLPRASGVELTSGSHQAIPGPALHYAGPAAPEPPPGPAQGPPPADMELPAEVLAFASVAPAEASAAPAALDASAQARGEQVPPPSTPEGATGAQVDPFVEFHEVFREIRQHERESQGVKQNPLDLLTQGPEPAADQAAALERFKTGRLDLKGGGLAPPSIDELAADIVADLTPRDDSDLVEAVIREAAHSIPPPEELEADRKRRLLASMNPAGEDAAAAGQSSAATRGLLGFSLILLTVVAVFTVGGWRNGGTLDLKDPAGMLRTAFYGPPPAPPAQPPETRIFEGQDLEPESRSSALELGGLQTGIYTNEAGLTFVLVDGHVRSARSGRHQNILVVVDLLGVRGEPLARRVIPAGTRLDQRALESSQTEAELAQAHQDLYALGEGLRLERDERLGFSAAFLLDPSQEPQELGYAVSIEQAQAFRENCWVPVAFEPAPDHQGAVDAVPLAEEALQ